MPLVLGKRLGMLFGDGELADASSLGLELPSTPTDAIVELADVSSEHASIAEVHALLIGIRDDLDLALTDDAPALCALVVDELSRTRDRLFQLVLGDELSERSSVAPRRLAASPSPSACGSEASSDSDSDGSDDSGESIAASETPETADESSTVIMHEDDVPSPLAAVSASLVSPMTSHGSSGGSGGGAQGSGRRRRRRRGRRSEPRAFESLDNPRLQIVCLPCEPRKQGELPCKAPCRTEVVKEDMRFSLAVERQQERAAAYVGDALLVEAHRTARYHLYRAFCSHEFAGEPQGSGQRVKLPDCFEEYVRTTFPNPICGAGCDYLRGCERAGHYTGFLSAEESKERRMQLREAGWEPLWKEDAFI